MDVLLKIHQKMTLKHDSSVMFKKNQSYVIEGGDPYNYQKYRAN